MKIQYASDLHLEFQENSEFLALHPLEVKGDILVLAGDTHVFRGKSWENHPFFDWCAEHYQQTYIIPGNHEYYDRVELCERFDDYEYCIRENVHYINNRSVMIENTEFFFTTLWTIIPPAELVAVQMGLTDCHRIKYQGRSFTSQDYEALHQKCVEWLSGALSTSIAKHKVVITHHQPTLCISDPRFTSSPINSAFAVDMDTFIEHCDAEYWIYGHTHYNDGTGSVIGQTKLLCNQLGYVRHNEHNLFSSNATITIGD